jgi:virginiamycin A acetyltransferase
MKNNGMSILLGLKNIISLILKTYRGNKIGKFCMVNKSAKITNSSLSGLVSVYEGCIVDNCNINGNKCVSIGAHTILSGPVLIVADCNEIHIGKYCSIAANVAILEASHHVDHISTYYLMSEIFGLNAIEDVSSKGSINIENDVWIGTSVTILSGVQIGNGAIIGAGSVVTKNIPPYAIAAGVPARIIRYRFPPDICEKLIKLCWWDWPLERILKNYKLFSTSLDNNTLDAVIT